MKSTRSQLFVLSVLLLMVALLKGSIYAMPVPLLQVTELYQQSDIVAIGQVQAVSVQENSFINWNSSRISGRVMRAELFADKLIKGSLQQPRLSFDFFQPNDFLGFQPVSKGQYGMFFLKRSSSTLLSVTSPYYPYIIALADPIKTTGVGLSRVAEELALVLNSPKTTLAEKISAIKAMETVKLSSVNLLLKKASQTSDEQLKLNLVSALLKRGETSLLQYAVNVLLSPSQSTSQNQLLQLASSIELGVHDPNSLPLLVRLLKTKQAQIRRATAEAIRSTKVESAIDPLASLLFDPDADVRYVAVIGLAEITGQYQWGPAQDVFRDNEQRYLGYWKAWSKPRQK